MKTAFWQANPSRVGNLLALALSDPEKFVEIIDDRAARDWRQQVGSIPIFVDANPDAAADLFFELPPETMNQVLEPFERRVLRLESNSTNQEEGRSEREWLATVKTKVLNLASDAGSIKAAQVRMAVECQLGFLDASDPDGA